MLDEELDMFEEMIEHNEFLLDSLRDDGDRTILMVVALASRFRLFSFLIGFRQEFEAIDFKGRNIVHSIVLNANDDDCVRMLDLLNKETTKETFTRLVNHSDGYGNPLHVAAWWNHHNTIKFLTQNGADVNVKNKRGLLPEEHEDCDNITKGLIRSCRT